MARRTVIWLIGVALLAAACPMPSFKSDKTPDAALRRIDIYGLGKTIDLSQVRAEIMGNHLTRWLAALPPNELTPGSYRDFVRQLAKREGWQMQFLDDGREPIENDGWFCFNSPYRDWLPEYLMEYLENLDIDGFYFDDTNYGSHQGGSAWYPSCCCPYCERLFKQETGLDTQYFDCRAQVRR